MDSGNMTDKKKVAKKKIDDKEKKGDVKIKDIKKEELEIEELKDEVDEDDGEVGDLKDIGGDNINIPEPKIYKEIGRLAKEMGSSVTSKEHPIIVLSDIASPTECVAIAGLLANNSLYHSNYREQFVLDILRLRVSLDRQGRREVIHTLRSVAQGEQEGEQQGIFGRMKNFMGFGGRRDYI